MKKIINNEFFCKIINLIFKIFRINKIKKKKGNILKIENAIAYKFLVDIYGRKNEIFIKNNCRLKNTSIIIKGNNNKVIIKDNARINYTTICCEGDNNIVIIEEDVLIFGKTEIDALEGTSVTIGKKNLFSSNIIIRTGDSHSVIDLSTNNRINYSESIKIGNNVWVTEGVTILKGSQIPDNSVIATKAMVNSKFEVKNTIIGGIPAKIIKRNIDWRFDKI